MSATTTPKQKTISDFMAESVDIATAFSTQPPDTDFVLPGFVAGTVGCLAAAGSTGKSFAAIEAAMGIASAGADLALLNLGIKKHGKVVIFNAEDPDTVLQQRLYSIGQHFNTDTCKEVAKNLSIKSLMGRGGDINDPVWFDEILRASTGCRLVIFDTFSRWHKLSENDNGEMAQVVGQYEQIARETGAAVLFLHHTSKGMSVSGRQDEQQATRGAASITDNARWQGFMQTMSDKEALKFGIADADRKQYVRFGGNKENYGSSGGDRWLERVAGGVLKPIDFDVSVAPVAKVRKLVKQYED